MHLKPIPSASTSPPNNAKGRPEMLTQSIQIPTRPSRIEDGRRPSVIPATQAIDKTGSISIINGSGIPIYVARRGSMIPFIIPAGQAETIQSIAEQQETILVWNSDGRGPLRHCLHRETIEVIADTARRIRWTGYGFRNA